MDEAKVTRAKGGGRRPRPVEQTLLSGETRLSRVNYDRPICVTPLGDPPAFFTSTQRRIWDRMQREIKVPLSRIDGPVLASLCLAIWSWEEATTDLARATVEESVRIYRVINQLDGRIRRLRREFGLSGGI